MPIQINKTTCYTNLLWNTSHFIVCSRTSYRKAPAIAYVARFLSVPTAHTNSSAEWIEMVEKKILSISDNGTNSFAHQIKNRFFYRMNERWTMNNERASDWKEVLEFFQLIWIHWMSETRCYYEITTTSPFQSSYIIPWKSRSDTLEFSLCICINNKWVFIKFSFETFHSNPVKLVCLSKWIFHHVYCVPFQKK